MEPGDYHSTQQYVQELTEFRLQKDRFFATSPDSPIPPAQQNSGFEGLRYYPPDLTYRLEAQLIPFDVPEIVLLGSTKGDIRRHIRYGRLRFTIQGQTGELITFKDAEDPYSNELFVPFRDSTSGGATYGAGRYVEVQDDTGDAGPHTVVLDFNLAYSPWCAYNIAYSCALPPAENTLTMPIMAGELLFPVDQYVS